MQVCGWRSLGDFADLLPVGDSAFNTKLREGLVLEMAAQVLQVATLSL